MKRLLIAVCAAPLLGGCAAVAPDMIDCPDPKLRNINITWQKQNNNVRLQAAPNRAEVDPGDILRIRVSGSPSATVTVAGKASDPDASWISGTTTGADIFICVDAGVAPDKSYMYDVTVTGIGTLDPEVRVRN